MAEMAQIAQIAEIAEMSIWVRSIRDPRASAGSPRCMYIRTDSVRRTRDGQGTTGTRAGARLAFTHTGPSTSPARVFSAAEIFHLGDLGSPGVYLGYEPCAMGHGQGHEGHGCG